jgi:hypothetical protein
LKPLALRGISKATMAASSCYRFFAKGEKFKPSVQQVGVDRLYSNRRDDKSIFP